MVYLAPEFGDPQANIVNGNFWHFLRIYGKILKKFLVRT